MYGIVQSRLRCEMCPKEVINMEKSIAFLKILIQLLKIGVMIHIEY